MYQSKPCISIIVAAAQNYAIGKNNDLLWHLSDDLKRFKALTSGHTIIMGRKTFESLPKKPLPKRKNIVLTHDTDFAYEGVTVAHTLQDVLTLSQDEDECFIIGGAAIYKQFMPFTQHIYVTWVYKDFDADVFFPKIDSSVFRQTHISERMQDPENGLCYAYAEYTRIPQK